MLNEYDIRRYAREILRKCRSQREDKEKRRVSLLQGEFIPLEEGYAMLVKDLTKLSKRARFWA